MRGREQVIAEFDRVDRGAIRVRNEHGCILVVDPARCISRMPNVALQPRRFMIAPSADSCKRMLCRRLWPEANVNSPRFGSQHRSVHIDRLQGSFEKLTTRHKEIRSRELREFVT